MKAYSRASMAAGRSEPGQGPVRPQGQRQSRLRSIRSTWPGTLCADLTVLIRGSVSSELFGGGSSGVGCAAPETGEQLEILVFILHADLLHRRVHPRVNDVETEHLRTLAARRPDDDTAALRGVAVAVDPAAAFEPVEDAGHGGGAVRRTNRPGPAPPTAMRCSASGSSRCCSQCACWSAGRGAAWATASLAIGVLRTGLWLVSAAVPMQALARTVKPSSPLPRPSRSSATSPSTT